LVDQNLAVSIADRLTEAGQDAVHTFQVGLAKASDPEIFEWCRTNDRVLVTEDKKLPKYVASEGASSPSVAIFRDFEDKVWLVGDLVASPPAIEATITIAGKGDAVFSVVIDRPVRAQLLPLGPSEVISD